MLYRAVITDKDTPSLTHNRIIMNAAEIGVGAEIIDRSKKVRGKIKNRFIYDGKYNLQPFHPTTAMNVT